MDRRKLLVQAGAVLAAGALPAQAGPTKSSAAIGQVNPAVLNPSVLNPAVLKRVCRTRPNINGMPAADLDAFKTGVANMMARPASDPTSWSYQAAMHSTYTTPTMPLWNGCMHGSIHFLSWHRLFLYYFERILRAASGSSSLMLPYWNWTADRAMPAPFLDTSAGNPLYTSHRYASINGGGLLPASAVAITTPLADIGFNAFSGDLEGTPHGAVHVSIGGWMHDVPSAAQDPIFWLHHCNIDRLWEAWIGQGGGRTNPTDAGWLNTNFTFYDYNGVQRTMKASKGLDTCQGLGYRYPSRLKVHLVSPAWIALLSTLEASRIHAAPNAPAATMVLGAEASESKLPLPKGSGRTYLAFEDIRAENSEGYYEIYLNPPVGKALEFTDPSYAGNLVLFGLTDRERAVHHAGMGEKMAGMDMAAPRRVFDISRKLEQMRSTAAASESLRVVLVLRLPEGENARAQLVRAKIGRVQLIVQ